MMAVLGGVLGQDAPTADELHGKNSEQIAQMGHDRWYDYFIDAEGNESTMAMSRAESIYGWALKTENNKFLTVSKTMVGPVESFRKYATAYRIACIEVGRAYSGGGTMWTPVYAGAEARTEEVVRFWLEGTGKGENATQAEVWKALRQGLSDLTKQKDEIIDGAEYSGIKYDEVKKSMNSALVIFGDQVSKMGGMSEGVKGRIFGLYLNGAKMTQMDDTP